MLNIQGQTQSIGSIGRSEGVGHMASLWDKPSIEDGRSRVSFVVPSRWRPHGALGPSLQEPADVADGGARVWDHGQHLQGISHCSAFIIALLFTLDLYHLLFLLLNVFMFQH